MWTVDDILRYKPCYTREQIAACFGSAQSITTQEIAALDAVPIADRLWILWRLLPLRQRQQALDRIVARAVTAYALPEPSTEGWVRRWLKGVDRTQAAAAATRAADAAAGAADAAAGAAAAAWAAAAAAGAADAAAWAADAAAGAGARAAEEHQQLADICQVLDCIDRPATVDHQRYSAPSS